MQRLTILILIIISSTALAEGKVTTRIIDVGAALCTITEMPDNKFFVYDTGTHRSNTCFNAIKKVVQFNDIALMVISHNDADHYGGISKILNNYAVDTMIWTGYSRWENKSWTDTVKAVANAKESNDDMHIIELGNELLQAGKTFTYGDVKIEFIYGLSNWREQGYVKKPNDHGLNSGELRNVISIVMRLTYGDNSILFAGDSIGRDLDGDENQCSYAESVMVEQTPELLPANVLVAAHHGADNGSSRCFIKKVKPKHVIFSAGSKDSWAHPRISTVERIKAESTDVKFYRTDLGDDEANDKHFEDETTVAGCNDKSKDDDIEIVIEKTGEPSISYTDSPNGSSCH